MVITAIPSSRTKNTPIPARRIFDGIKKGLKDASNPIPMWTLFRKNSDEKLYFFLIISITKI
ncbi:MAG: hypothetical protein Kow00108_24330 [Calditrichia bacterium]